MSAMVALPDTWGGLKQLGLVYTEQWDHVYVKEEGQCISASGGKENQPGHHLGSVSLTSPLSSFQGLSVLLSELCL